MDEMDAICANFPASSTRHAGLWKGMGKKSTGRWTGLWTTSLVVQTGARYRTTDAPGSIPLSANLLLGAETFSLPLVALPPGRCSFASSFAPLLRRQPRRASLAALQPALAAKRDSSWVFALVGIGRRFTGRLSDDGRGELVHIGRTFARPLRHDQSVAPHTVSERQAA